MALPMCRICSSLKTHIVFFYWFICIEESAKSTALVYTHIHFAWKAYCCLLLTKHPSGIVLHNFTEQVLRYLILAHLQRDQSQAALIKVLISAHWLLTVEIALPFSFRNHMPVCLPFLMMFLVFNFPWKVLLTCPHSLAEVFNKSKSTNLHDCTYMCVVAEVVSWGGYCGCTCCHPQDSGS